MMYSYSRTTVRYCSPRRPTLRYSTRTRTQQGSSCIHPSPAGCTSSTRSSMHSFCSGSTQPLSVFACRLYEAHSEEKESGRAFFSICYCGSALPTPPDPSLCNPLRFWARISPPRPRPGLQRRRNCWVSGRRRNNTAILHQQESRSTRTPAIQ